MDQLTESTLKEWGFEQYVVRFKEAEIDFAAFLTLTENMVAELIPNIGHRSKFVNSLKLLNEKHNKETSSKDIPDENTSDKSSTSENIQKKHCTSELKPVLAPNQDKMPQKQWKEKCPLEFFLDFSQTRSNNSSSQSKRQRISSNSSSSKHEFEASSKDIPDEAALN